MLIFNNGTDRPSGQYSTVDEFVPPVESNGSYYLEPDSAYGPEHYITTENMTLPNYNGDGKSLYGTYKFRVHYMSDHDGDFNSTQPITWKVYLNYLAFEDSELGLEYWEEQTWTGTLSTSSYYNTQVFDNMHDSWGPIYEIKYARPNPMDYDIPPPPQNELPD
jgi:hypothetical protein